MHGIVDKAHTMPYNTLNNKPNTHILEENSMRLWYAAMQNTEDTDWGIGSHYLPVAKAMAQNYNSDFGAYIVVIADGDDPVAVDEIHDIEITDEEIREVAEMLAAGAYNPEDRDIIQSEFYFSDEDMDRILAAMAEIQ